MRTVLLAHLFISCGGLDQAPPALVDARAASGVRLGVADPRAPLVGPLVQTTTRPTVALIFSERLDGDAIEEVITDRDTGAVRELVGRDGVVRISPNDGSVVAEYVLEPDGSPSPLFGDGGRVILQAAQEPAWVGGVAVTASGGTVIGVCSGGGRLWEILRLHPDGSPDPSLAGDGSFTHFVDGELGETDLTELLVDAAGGIVALGHTSRTEYLALKLKP